MGYQGSISIIRIQYIWIDLDGRLPSTRIQLYKRLWILVIMCSSNHSMLQLTIYHLTDLLDDVFRWVISNTSSNQYILCSGQMCARAKYVTHRKYQLFVVVQKLKLSLILIDTFNLRSIVQWIRIVWMPVILHFRTRLPHLTSSRH
jgi:hypothetical protein